MESHGPLPPDISRGPTLRTISVVTFAFVMLSGSLRMVTRGFIVRQFGWDDYTMVLALTLLVISTAFNIQQVKVGGGRHVFYLTLPQIIEAQKYTDLAQLFLVLITCLVRTSIALFLIRIPNSKRLVKFLYGLIFTVIVVNVFCAIMLLVQCRPVTGLWDPTVKASCWNMRVYLVVGYFQGIFLVITDLICSGLPIAVLWKVQISRPKKIAICALMAAGLLATACCIVRLTLFHIATDRVDPTWSIIDTEIWACLEQNISIIAANMPVMLPLYKYLHEKIPPKYRSLRALFQKQLPPAKSSQYSSVHERPHKMEVRGPRLDKTLPGIPTNASSITYVDGTVYTTGDREDV